MATQNDIHGSSTPSLMAGVLSDVKKLATGHLEHTRREMGEEMTELKLTLMRATIAVGVLSVGSVMLGHAIVAGLVALGMPAWSGYLLVAAIGMSVGFYLLAHWKPNSSEVDLIPEGSFDKLKDDIQDIGAAARDS